MSAFHFSLQPVLRVRLAERDDRRVRLGEAYHAERVLRDRLMQAASERARIRDMVRSASAPGQVNVDSLLQTHRYELVVSAEIQVMEKQLTQVAEEIERRRQALIEADRQVRVLEKLRDRRYAEYQQESRKREFRELDEIAQRQSSSGRHD
jgi:flagellar FliJ protein